MPASLADSGSLLIVIAIICLTIGYVFGWLISSIQRGREEKARLAAEGEPSAGEEPVANQASEAAAGEAGRQPPIFSLRRGEGADSLLVDLAGKTFSEPASLSMNERAQIEGMIRRTANWMGLSYSLGGGPAPAAPATPPPARPTPVSGTPTSGSAPRQPSVISGVTNVLADALQPAAKKEAPRSIVQQIDEILQGLLEGTPYEAQQIYLMEDPHKGVIVRVGNEVYEGVGAVPEGEIKNMLRAAVAEWERRQETNRRRPTV